MSRKVASLSSSCDGDVLTAGFQNSHVHLNGPAFPKASTAKAATLEAGLAALLTRYGFTTAFDIASDRDTTLALRARVNQGEVNGPRLLTAGLSFLMTPQRNQPAKRMPADIAAAAATQTHQRGKLVFAHPTELAGVRATLQARVDILAHPSLGAPAPWPVDLMDALRSAGTYMVPTLKLLRYELDKEQVPQPHADRVLMESVREFGKFAASGGKVLFGTDVDYMEDSDPTEEYELLAKAGLTPMQILASLTTTPAGRWKESSQRGRLMAGMAADLVILEADPAESLRNFAAVKCTIREGRVIYRR